MLSDDEIREVNMQIEGDIIKETLKDLMGIPPSMRDAAIRDYEMIDPDLGRKLRLAMYFAL